eukprot:4347759-Amphidinium_carterae.1
MHPWVASEHRNSSMPTRSPSHDLPSSSKRLVWSTWSHHGNCGAVVHDFQSRSPPRSHSLRLKALSTWKGRLQNSSGDLVTTLTMAALFGRP